MVQSKSLNWDFKSLFQASRISDFIGYFALNFFQESSMFFVDHLTSSFSNCFATKFWISASIIVSVGLRSFVNKPFITSLLFNSANGKSPSLKTSQNTTPKAHLKKHTFRSKNKKYHTKSLLIVGIRVVKSSGEAQRNGNIFRVFLLETRWLRPKSVSAARNSLLLNSTFRKASSKLLHVNANLFHTIWFLTTIF